MKKSYKTTQKLVQNKSASFVQKYLKGYKVHNEYREIIHRAKIDGLMNHYREIKKLMQTDSQIKIRYHWFKYKKRKAKRLAMEKKKRLEA